MKRLLLAGLIFSATGAACSPRSVATSVPPRLFREVHGLRVRSYQMTPVTGDLRQYKAIEIHKLNNLMLDEIPAQSVEQLNAGIVRQIKSLNRFDQVTVIDAATQVSTASGSERDSQERQGIRSGNQIAPAAEQPTLAVEGFIDDFTPGIPKLRYIEQGNNHAILTVRITLKDKQTAGVLGQMNITVENTRVTSNVDRMVNKSAEEVAGFVRRSAAHSEETKGAHANVER